MYVSKALENHNINCCSIRDCTNRMSNCCSITLICCGGFQNYFAKVILVPMTEKRDLFRAETIIWISIYHSVYAIQQLSLTCTKQSHEK